MWQNTDTRFLHVPSVAEIDSTLSSSFVAAVLQTDNILTSFQLFLGELANVLLSFFGSNARLSEISSLKIK